MNDPLTRRSALLNKGKMMLGGMEEPDPRDTYTAPGHGIHIIRRDKDKSADKKGKGKDKKK